MLQQTIHLFVFDTLSDWEPAFAIAGINNPAFQAQPGRYCVKTVGVSKASVKSIGGLTILPDLALNELDPGQSAMLILPGGAGWDELQHLEAIEKVRQFPREHSIIMFLIIFHPRQVCHPRFYSVANVSFSNRNRAL